MIHCLFHSYCIWMAGEYHAGDPFRWYRVQTGTQGGSFSSRGSSWSQEACSWQGQSKKSSQWIFGSVDRVWPLREYLGARIQSIWWPECRVCREIEELINSYHKTSSISSTKSQSLNVSCIFLQLSSLNPLEPGVKLRMKCSWSSADRRCSNYIWLINNFIA